MRPRPIALLLAAIVIAAVCTEASAQQGAPTREASEVGNPFASPVRAADERESERRAPAARSHPADLLLVEVRDGELQLPEFTAEEVADPEPADLPARIHAPPAELAPRADARVGDPDAVRAVYEASAYYRVDPALVFCLMRQESGFRRYAVSPKGASGYMQLMPATARRFGVTDIFDKRQNIWGGVRYLRLLLTMFRESVPLALAGYNAGEYRVIREGYRVPQIAETQNYVRAITARYGRLTHAYPTQAAAASSAPLLRSASSDNRAAARGGRADGPVRSNETEENER